MIKAGVVGIAGRMGSLIARGVVDAQDMVLSGALEVKGHPLIGKDAGSALKTEPLDVGITDSIRDAFEDADVLIDFTLPEVGMETVRYASAYGKKVVIGTTGFTDAHLSELKSLSSTVPMVLAPNMSIGVNVMFKVVSILTRLLGDAYDTEIVEAHHRLKKDAPSGTALGLARSIAEARGVDLADHARYERCGIIGQRPQGEIGIQTLRAGDIVGDHTVFFAGNNERIEIKHQAHSRQNFSQGALRATRWIMDKTPGQYSMMDVLGI